jgi:hypothetical protein
MEYQFGDKHAAATILNCHPNSLARSRRNTSYGWIEGIHFVRVNASNIRYNLTLLNDWLMNRHDPNAHHRAIENYCQVISHQRRQRKSKAL